MNRRSFLQRLGGVAAALVAGPAIVKALEPETVPVTITDQTSIGFMFQKGDVFTIEGRWVTNPITGEAVPGVLQQFVVVAEVTDRSVPAAPVQIVRAPGLGWVYAKQCRPTGWQRLDPPRSRVKFSRLLDPERWGP